MAQPAESHNSWLKWVIATLIALLGAGGGIVALLNYIKPPPPATNPPPTQSAPVEQRTQGAQSPIVSGTGNSVNINNIQGEAPKQIPKLDILVKTPEDVQKLHNFLKEHVRTVVYLKLEFLSKKEGGVSDFGWEDWLGGAWRENEAKDVDITFDLEEGEVKGGHLILRIDKQGHYYFQRRESGDGLTLEGNFTHNWIGEVGQGYEVSSLTPAN